MTDHKIRVRTWMKASDQDIREGLLGWISVEYGRLILDGVTLRRTLDGRFALSFPSRSDRAGRRHAYIRPVDDTVRQEIERELLWQLGEREDFEPAAGGQP